MAADGHDTHSHSSRALHVHFEEDEKGHKEIPRSLKRAVMVTLVFMVVEMAGGFIANSLALISDAFHMLMDTGAILLSLIAYWVARRPSTPMMSFGYYRAEILGALFSGLLIWLVAGILIYEAVMRLESPPEVKGPIVFVVALIGLTANLIAMKMLHPTKKKSINVRAAYLHLIADSMGSVAAVISGAVLWWSGWRPIDPILTLGIAGLMLWSSWGLVKEAVGVLMESAPSHLNPSEIQAALEGIKGVEEVHDLHIWSVSTGRLALSVHLISKDTETALNSANRLLQEKYAINHTTIQVEHPDTFDFDRCYDCASR